MTMAFTLPPLPFALVRQPQLPGFLPVDTMWFPVLMETGQRFIAWTFLDRCHCFSLPSRRPGL